MIIYIDSEFKCHLNNYDEVYREVETDFFDGKCDEYIYGFRFVPSGERWTREDGTVFEGEMVAPWMDYDELAELQRVYEQQLLSDYEALINELYSEVTAE